jgi:hypothetical protein
MKLTHKSIGTLFAGLVVLGLSATAQAQDPPPPSDPPPPAPVRHSSSGGGAGIGVGITQTIASTGAFGLGAGQFVYDQSLWHLEGLFGFDSYRVGPDDRATRFLFGAGGWFHFNQGSSSDFSLGGVIVVDTTSQPGGSVTTTVFEPGALIRAFVTPNVAIFARGGLAFVFGDNGRATEIGLGGQLTGAFGVTYFFR